MHRIAPWLAALLALLVACAPAAAQGHLQTFPDRSAFEAAVGEERQSVSFEDLTELTEMQTYSAEGVTFSSPNGDTGDLQVVGPDYYGFPQLTSKALTSNRNYSPMVMTFDPPAGAVGLDVLCLPEGESVVLKVEGTAASGSFEESFPLALAAETPTFVGVRVQSGSITRVTVSNAPDQLLYVTVDNVSYVPGEQGDPLGAALDRLSRSIHEGRENGAIRSRSLARLLQSKVEVTRVAVERNLRGVAASVLRTVRSKVRAQQGKKISRERASELIDLTNECLELLRR